MRIKVVYRKNLKMSPGKLAAQTGHAVLGLNGAYASMSIVVLEASDKKFQETKAAHPEACVVRDAGRTEVAPGTETVLAYFEDGQ
jgi:peptidyl-tRNA hydrolase